MDRDTTVASVTPNITKYSEFMLPDEKIDFPEISFKSFSKEDLFPNVRHYNMCYITQNYRKYDFIVVKYCMKT